MVFSGTYPGTNQVFTDLWRDPHHSRLRFLRRFSAYRLPDTAWARTGIRAMVRLLSRYPCPMPENIPAQRLWRFDHPVTSGRLTAFKGPGPVPSLIDHLRWNGIRFHYEGPPFSRFPQRPIQRLTRLLKAHPDYVFVHIPEPDPTGHEHGPDSTVIARLVREIDGETAALCRDLEGLGIKFRLLVHSDHGMARVRKCIDLKTRILKWPLIPGRDFDFFLDSTMARFWVRNEEVGRMLTDLIKEDSFEARLLTPEDREAGGLGGLDARFGDLIAVVEEGTLILPNDYQRQPVRGMHGYLDGSSKGVVAWKGLEIPNEDRSISLLDMFPTVLDGLGISPDANLPGRSLLQPNRGMSEGSSGLGMRGRMMKHAEN